MGLVDYPDSVSDGSDTKAKSKPKPIVINKKAAFQKFTDSSTGKIHVSNNENGRCWDADTSRCRYADGFR